MHEHSDELKRSITGIVEQVDDIRNASINFLQDILEAHREEPGYVPTLKEIQRFAMEVAEISHRRHQLMGCIDCGPAIWEEVDGEMRLREE